MKKGRHRRFEEARALKRSSTDVDLDGVLIDEDPIARRTEPCDECGAEPGAAHASWCRAEEDDDPYGEFDADDD